MTIITMPDLGRPMEVHAELSDVDDGRLAIGMTGNCTLDAYPMEPLPCSVKEIAPVARTKGENSLRRAFAVVVGLGKTDAARMRPGMSVKVELRRPTATGVVVVPRAAIVEEAPAKDERLAARDARDARDAKIAPAAKPESGEGSSGDARSADGKPADAKSRAVKSGDTKSGDAKPADAKPNTATAGVATPRDAKSGDSADTNAVAPPARTRTAKVRLANGDTRDVVLGVCDSQACAVEKGLSEGDSVLVGGGS